MGQGSKYSNFSSGNGLRTRGGKTIIQSEYQSIVSKQPLVGELIKRGVKINPKDVVFAVKDNDGITLWLEKGNTTKGLEHIKRHTNDFISKHGIQEKHLVAHLRNIVKKGVVVSSQSKILSNGKTGLERIYLYKGKYYTVGAIGTNGYIVSMYPISGGKK